MNQENIDHVNRILMDKLTIDRLRQLLFFLDKDQALAALAIVVRNAMSKDRYMNRLALALYLLLTSIICAGLLGTVTSATATIGATIILTMIVVCRLYQGRIRSITRKLCILGLEQEQR
jgi:hypothetical protein